MVVLLVLLLLRLLQHHVHTVHVLVTWSATIRQPHMFTSPPLLDQLIPVPPGASRPPGNRSSLPPINSINSKLRILDRQRSEPSQRHHFHLIHLLQHHRLLLFLARYIRLVIRIQSSSVQSTNRNSSSLMLEVTRLVRLLLQSSLSVTSLG